MLLRNGKKDIPLVLLKRESKYAEKSIPVGNVLPLRFESGTNNKVRRANTNRSWYSEILVVFTTSVGAPV